MNLQATHIISKSLVLNAFFKGSIIIGTHSIKSSVLFFSNISKLPNIAKNLYGSNFSFNPSTNKGKKCLRSIFEGSDSQIILFVLPE